MRCIGTLPVTCSWAGAVDPPDLDTYNHIIFVALAPNTTTDGSLQFPYHTVAEGLAEAVARTPSSTNKICVYVFSGIYNEGSLSMSQYVYLQGANVESTIITSPNKILTIGVDNSSVSGITFRAGGSNEIVSVDGTSMTDYTTFRNCHFVGNGNNTNVIKIEDDGLAKFYDCVIEAQNVGDRIIETTSDVDNDCKIYKTTILGDILHAGGNLELTDVTANAGVVCTGSSDLSITDTFLRNSIDHCVELQTTGNIYIYQSTLISPGLVVSTNYHCVNATVNPTTNEWISNTFRHDGTSPDYTVYSSVSFTFAGDRNNFEEGYNSNCTDNGLSEKTTPLGADIFILEDTADRRKRKRVQLANLPGGGTGLPTPTEVGQFLYSWDGVVFSITKPLVTDDGFLVTDDDGHIVVTG